MKNFGEKGAWAYPGTAQVFWVPSIISGTGKATNFKLGRYIQRVHANKILLKIWKNRECGRIQGLPKFLKYPLLSQEWVKLRTSNWQIYSEGPCEQKWIKNLGENGAWAYPGTAQMFWVPPIISGTDKATNFKFCTHILSIDRNKRPLQISGKVAGCVVRTLETFQGTHILGASRGLLCDSSAVLYDQCLLQRELEESYKTRVIAYYCAQIPKF